MTPEDKKPWRDFAHTVRVITARALSEYEISEACKRAMAGSDVVPFAPRSEAQQPGQGGRPAARFELERLAAATAEELSLRNGEIHTRDGTIVGRFGPIDGHLRLALQLKGFALLSTYGGRMARLRCFNGVETDYFRFDEQGSAEIELPDDEVTRSGLGHVTLEFDDD